jgi:ceramide glucosyltransferase
MEETIAAALGALGVGQLAGGVIAAASIIYLLLALWRVTRYRPSAEPLAGGPLPVTVLKPVCGAEPGLYECLRSFCEQDHPCVQLIFGLRDHADPAIPVIERLIKEFPARDLALVIDPRVHGTNLKVSNLINMHRAAKHDILVLSDSDTRIERRCLSRVTAAFGDPRLGAATCLYKAMSLGGVASRLGALFINDWFLSSAIVDAGMREVAYCFGPLTAIRREALDAIGGFRRLASQLADDFLLGRLVAAKGWKLRLSDCLVDTVVAESFRSLLLHELRWARTVKTVKPGEHFLSVVTEPLPLLLVLLLPHPSLWGMAALALSIGLRVGLHVAVQRRLRPGEALAPWLLPLRECLCFGVWAWSFLGSHVHWRQRRFAIGRGGRLIALEQRA